MANVTFLDNKVSLNKETLKKGDNAPKVVCVDKDLKEVTIGQADDKVEVLISLPSLDTPVCATQSKTFNEKLREFDVNAYVISMDLPFASGRFCTSENISNIKALSDFRNKGFSKEYGVLIDDSVLKGLSTRAIFIIKDGVIQYSQIVPEITREPNYDEAINALKNII